MACSVKIGEKSLSEALLFLGRVMPLRARLPILGCIGFFRGDCSSLFAPSAGRPHPTGCFILALN